MNNENKIEEEEVEVEFKNEESYNVIFQRKEDPITVNILSLNEMIKVLCTRADEIEDGAVAYIQTSETNAWKIAMKELVQGMNPLTVIRSRGFIGNVEIIEEWKVNDLIIPPKCISNISDIIDFEFESPTVRERLEALLNK